MSFVVNNSPGYPVASVLPTSKPIRVSIRSGASIDLSLEEALKLRDQLGSAVQKVAKAAADVMTTFGTEVPAASNSHCPEHGIFCKGADECCCKALHR